MAMEVPGHMIVSETTEAAGNGLTDIVTELELAHPVEFVSVTV